MAGPRRSPAMTPSEALQFHEEVLVVDSQQPGATSGLLFNHVMREALGEFVAEGKTRGEIRKLMQALAAREVQTSPEARSEYMGLWEASGVDVASGTYAGPEPPETAFETSLTAMSQARAMIDALDDQVRLVLTADDIESVYRDGVRGVIFDFQDTTPFGSDLGSA